jgi:hypothetical protein
VARDVHRMGKALTQRRSIKDRKPNRGRVALDSGSILTSVLLLLSEQFLFVVSCSYFTRAFPPFRPSATAAGVLPLILRGRDVVLDLAGRDPHDVDGVADHVGRTAFTFGASGITSLA